MRERRYEIVSSGPAQKRVVSEEYNTIVHRYDLDHAIVALVVTTLRIRCRHTHAGFKLASPRSWQRP